MKKWILIILFFVDANCLLAQQKEREKRKDVSGSFEMNYLRHYLWRGALFGNNDVAQPVLELTKGKFSLGLCQNLNYFPKNVPQELYTKNTVFDEQDVELSFATSKNKFDIEAKLMAYFYFYQIGSPNTAEFAFNTSYNVTDNISIFTENSVDLVSYRGAIYSNNGIAFQKETNHNFLFEFSTYVAIANKKFNEIYYYTNSNAVNLAGTKLDITKTIGKCYIKGLLEYNKYLNLRIKLNNAPINFTKNFGIAAGVNF